MLVCISTAFVSGMLAGCTNDVYNPDAAETLVPPADTYFSFNTKAPVTLKVDYAMPGMPALIEVYDQKPVATDGNIRTLRQDLTPPVHGIYGRERPLRGKDGNTYPGGEDLPVHPRDGLSRVCGGGHGGQCLRV